MAVPIISVLTKLNGSWMLLSTWDSAAKFIVTLQSLATFLTISLLQISPLTKLYLGLFSISF